MTERCYGLFCLPCCHNIHVMVGFIPGYENVLRKIFNESWYRSLGLINSDFGIKYAHIIRKGI